jgi:FkbM family methyltransferase
MYSQDQEEQHILAALRDVPGFGHQARFLDIGAWHPKTFSNTRALFELGWSGVMIEPSPGPMLNLLADYGNEPRIALVSAAGGLETGFASMHITDDAVSTLDAKSFEMWKDHAKFHGSMSVPIITLEDIAMRFGGFDFWNIDAEGISVDLFKRMMVLGHEPRCVCVEHDGREGELISSASLKYNVVYGNGTNLVMVRK